jgi:hypothetical protein
MQKDKPSNLPILFTVFGQEIKLIDHSLMLNEEVIAELGLNLENNFSSIIIPGLAGPYFAELAPGEVTYDGCSSDPPGNSGVTISHQFQPLAGGHVHPVVTYNNNFPPSRHYGPGEMNTYTVGPVSGEVYTNIKTGMFNLNVVLRVSVGQGSFVHIGSSDDYVLIGTKPIHPSSHWGTPDVVAKLKAIASEYRQETGDKLYFNDMSLPWGGILDINANWGAPHAEHRNGNVIDIAATSQTMRRETIFVRILGRYTRNYLIEGRGSTRHYHVRF